jgi:hypothetical protein
MQLELMDALKQERSWYGKKVIELSEDRAEATEAAKRAAARITFLVRTNKIFQVMCAEQLKKDIREKPYRWELTYLDNIFKKEKDNHATGEDQNEISTAATSAAPATSTPKKNRTTAGKRYTSGGGDSGGQASHGPCFAYSEIKRHKFGT